MLMKCLQCEGEWLPPTNVSISLDNCPFCGIPILNIEKAKSYTSLSNFLQYIVSLYGPEIYNNKQNLNGIIADLYTGEKRFKRIYHRAIMDSNLSQYVFKLSKNDLNEYEIYYNYIVFKFFEDNYIQSAIGLQIIDEFILGLNLDIKKPSILEDDKNVNYWIDEFGAKYSKDKKTLIKGVNIAFYTIKETTISIAQNAFTDCFELVEIVIPNSVIRIGEEAFSYCKNLERIKIPNSVTYIGDAAFDSCESLTGIKLPDSVIHIGIWTFACCKNIVDVRLSKSITILGEGTFAYCEKLHHVKIPKSVTVIHRNAFKNTNIQIDC